jgi:bisphosphoglycerate-independent phosphoglycerate mutase (AlkP superfamily)
MTPRENVRQLIAGGQEFNVTLDLEILQQVYNPMERDKRVGRCQATFHVTPKMQHKLKDARKKDFAASREVIDPRPAPVQRESSQSNSL